jgi:hypothetical protein
VSAEGESIDWTKIKQLKIIKDEPSNFFSPK